MNLFRGGILIAAFTALSFAGEPAVNKDKGGVALKGYDVVAYFTDDKAIQGVSRFEFTHQGAVYRFASAEHRDLFAKEPARYLPEYGGFCAYGASKGHAAPVDPQAFTVIDGKLYLNYNKSIQRSWTSDRDTAIRKADANWPAIQQKIAAK